jgi:uncharacterized protein YndB with AHSA1/START domain
MFFGQYICVLSHFQQANHTMPDIRHELIIEASAEKVYHTITSQEGLSSWWTPDTTAKPEIGTVSRFAFGPEYFKEMKITELKPSELVKWSCVAGFEEWVGTNISFRLFPGNSATLLKSHPEAAGQIEQLQKVDGGTLLKFEHNDWKEYSPTYSECNYTWGQFLRSLKLVCETGTGRPWPDQHKVDF